MGPDAPSLREDKWTTSFSHVLQSTHGDSVVDHDDPQGCKDAQHAHHNSNAGALSCPKSHNATVRARPQLSSYRLAPSVSSLSSIVDSSLDCPLNAASRFHQSFPPFPPATQNHGPRRPPANYPPRSNFSIGNSSFQRPVLGKIRSSPTTLCDPPIMFTAFRCDEPIQQQPRIITSPDVTSSPNPHTSDSTQYSRTACDFCRAKKLKCLGTGEACDRCLASFSTCTYTFSSGVGPGKKRRRKISDPRHAPSRRPVSPRSGYSPECDDGRFNTIPASVGTNNAWGGQDVTPATSVPPSELSNRHTVPATHDNSTSQERQKYCSDISLSGSGFALCPAKHLSAVPNSTPRLQHQSNSAYDFDKILDDNTLDDNEISLLDQESLQLFELSSPHIRDDVSSQAPRESPLGQANLHSRNKALTSQDQIIERSSSCACGRCKCLSAVVQGLDEFNLQRNADTETIPTDTLFLSVDKGTDQFSTLLACANCDLNDLSPILVITTINQLALMLSELVHRLTHCQSADTVPTVFQFGRYSVQKTKMRTSLLTSMIELHVKRLSQLIIRLEGCMADQPRLLLAGAKSIVTKMQQTLQAFSGGSYTDYDS